jgi:anti-sigma regulatory factor (Ser/Thr protein kinase)
MTGDHLRPLPPEQPPPGAAAAAARGTPAPGSAGAVVLEQVFDAGSLYALRSAVAAHASEAGLPPARIDDLVIAVHELAANAVRHGAGHGQVRLWADGQAVNCQVSDRGPEQVDGQGRREARPGGEEWESGKGHGLWLVRQLADHTSVRHDGDGTAVAVSFAFRPG